MTNTIKIIVKYLIRLAAMWLINALSLAGTALILPGLSFAAVDSTPRWAVIVGAALLLAIVNLLIRPIVLLMARPLGRLATLVIGFLVNALALGISAWLLPGFEVTILAALFGGIVFGFFNAVLTSILDIDDEGSLYQNRIERLAKRSPFDSADEPGVGLMMLEIDGLSYWHMQQAIDDGLMPTLQAMIEEDGYQLTRVECGLPSMTSACQAGIMFGDNHDIPAYRWYDKSKQKLYVSADDAAELNARYAHGQGLMRRGASVMNMMDGDAELSLFTMASMRDASPEEDKRRADDISLLMLDPDFLIRELALFFVELARELWQAWQQKRKNVEPRLNRLKEWYPFVRAAMCALMRDISANLAILNMMRGASSIYMLYLGYDEVAHHSGPWTSDAFGDLKRLDATLARLRRTIQEKALRPYDFIVLSDHGQSFGATFKQRYGLSIKEFIEQQLPAGATVSQQIGGDTGAYGLQGVAGELSNYQKSGSGNAFDRTLAKQGGKLAAQGAAKVDAGKDDTGMEASVVAYGSGNAAQVYFDLYPRKILLSELNEAYPGMVDAVVQHPGIGMVLGFEENGSAVVMGKGGTRNLETGEVVGEDPVAPYAPASGHGAASIETRVWQLKRVMDFPSAGDLWLISTLFEDGTVAALEELIGSHGGVGGEQTDAFLFHPPNLAVPETRNAVDVFAILNDHRGAPVVERATTAPAEAVVADWAPSTLLTGLGRVSTWLSLAARCIFLDHDAYKRVVSDAYMTGPALLIVLAMQTLAHVVNTGGFDAVQWLTRLGFWFVGLLGVTTAGYLLTRQGNFTHTFRGVGFAQSVYLLGLLAFIPGLAAALRVIVLFLAFVATWMGAATAFETRGWRTLLLPVVAFLVLLVGAIALNVLLTGTAFTLQSLP